MLGWRALKGHTLTAVGDSRKPVPVLDTLEAAGKWLTVLSLCTALGLHWAALQSVAWAGMLLSYSHSGSIASAVEMTFDGRHPCPLCQAIKKGEQNGKKQDFQIGKKMDMDYQPAAVLIAPTAADHEWARMEQTGARFAPEPGVPPPRAA